MSREEFQQLLKRYLEGSCSEEEKRVVEQWYSLLDDEELPALDPQALAASDTKLWEAIHANMNQTPVATVRPLSPPKNRVWTTLAIAASLTGVLLTIIGVLYQSGNQGSEWMQEASRLDTVNTSNKALAFVLSDGSTVTLQPQASLTYPRSFSSDKREVYLKGEAFFAIQKDSSRPFYVHSQQLRVQVVGTSFWVRSPEQQPTSEVTVVSGKVRVEPAKTPGLLASWFSKKEGVVLNPNQRVTYEQQEKELTIGLAAEPVLLAEATEATFQYSESPLKVVLERLEQLYGIQIQAANEGLYQCTFTGDLSNQNLYEQLELICQSMGARYEVKGLQIVLSGGKCG